MKITKIEKKKHLYLLEIDHTDQLYVTEDTIVYFMLTKEMELDQSTLDQIKDFAQFSHGKNRAIYYLSFKQRSKKEIQDYLKKQGIETQYIPRIITVLEKENWINDLRYAENYLSQNLHNGNKGPYILSQKLKEKGIDTDIITSLLKDYDSSQLSQQLAEKSLRKYQDKLPYKALKDKIIQQLLAKGFSLSESKAAVQNLEIQEDDELEEELIYKDLDKVYRKLSRRYDGYDLQQRILQNLSRKGYDFSKIKQALKEYL